MEVIATTMLGRATAAVSVALASAIILSVWNHVSQGAHADAFDTELADRLGSVRHQSVRGTPALAMVPREPDNGGRSKPSTAAPIATDKADSRLAAPPSGHATASAKNHSAPPQIGVAEPTTSANGPDASSFSLPNVSDLAIPVATVGLTALALDLSTQTGAPSFFAPAWSSSTRDRSSAEPAPATDPLRLPGPFHLFLTTGPVDGMSPPGGGANNAGASSGGNGTTGGVVNGVSNGVGNVVGTGVGAVSGVAGGLVNGLGNTVGAVLRR